MRALVTGASGFVGQHLLAHLAEQGDDAVGLDRSGTPSLDITDPGVVATTIADLRPDAVYHLAGLSHVGESWDAPQSFMAVNAIGTLNVLQACERSGVRRVLVIGSADEYGLVDPADVPIAETTALRPMTPYGASKVAADFLALQAFLGRGVPAIRVRAFNHTGPGQPPRFLVPSLAHRIVAAERAGLDEIVVGSLDAVRDILDVRDVVRAYRLLVTDGTPGEAYNVCSGRGVAVHEVADLLLANTPRALRLVVDPALVRPIEVPVLVGDATKITGATGWTPRYELEQTLADVLESFRAQPT